MPDTRNPFKKTAKGELTRKAQGILGAFDQYLGSRTTLPSEITIGKTAAAGLLNPHYDGTPTYNKIPIVVNESLP